MELLDVRALVAKVYEIMVTTISSSNKDELSTKLSIIIPAFNEEEHLANTISALKLYAPVNTEIIVVDNGSQDTTLQIAKNLGTSVIIKTDTTIAGLRNAGVEISSGDILIFIDADVTVTKEWGDYLKTHTIKALLLAPMQGTGSRCLAPKDGKWLNKHWFNLLTSYDAPYVNSGHLITTRELFDKIDGFSSELKTAEDYDFCMKAKNIEAIVQNEPKLPVYHYGYPETVSGFIKRERWHGKEDFQSWNSFISSKVGIAASGNFFLAISAILFSLLYASLSPVVSYFIFMLSISILLTLYKFDRKQVTSLLKTSCIFYLYLCGRSLALIDRLKDFFKSA